LDVGEDGRIVQPNLKGERLRPRLNIAQKIVLTPNDKQPEYVVDFGFFFMGAPSASDSRYLPSICSKSHGDGRPEDTASRYAGSVGAKADGYFGCREWAAQLYNPNRPYIDVTSYEMEQDYDAPVKKGKKRPMIPVNRIHPFVGFSRFDSPPKPVIGNNRGQWYCIADCPSGNLPGPISDIKIWLKRNGWAAPRRPKDVREFRDRPVKAGEFFD
jgi:hypothetical protein